MVGIINFLIIALFMLSSAFVSLSQLPYTANAEEEAKTETTAPAAAPFDPDVLEILVEMSDTLSENKTFSFDAFITNDITLDSGQTVQVGGKLTALVQKPDNAYAKFVGDISTREVWYSGTEITVYNENKNFYGQIKTPDNIDATMDFLIDTYDFSLPLADILNNDPYDSFMETTKSGIIMGDSMVGGKECTHLAMRAEYVDWQVWVSNEDPALPCKLVINYREIEGEPQYQAVFFNWNLNPEIAADAFKPKLPKDAVKINFIDFKKEKEQENESKK